MLAEQESALFILYSIDYVVKNAVYTITYPHSLPHMQPDRANLLLSRLSGLAP